MLQIFNTHLKANLLVAEIISNSSPERQVSMGGLYWVCFSHNRKCDVDCVADSYSQKG